MPYYLSPKNLNLGEQQEIDGEESRHILLAQRTRVGDVIKVQGPDKKRFACGVVLIKKERLVVKPLEEISVPQEPAEDLILFQAIVAEKALDFILQKGTELGLKKIVLFNSQNTATKLAKAGYEKKQDRWQKILREAAKQSERALPPVLEFYPGMDDVIQVITSLNKCFVLDINGEVLPQGTNHKGPLGLLVGPEGGLSASELGLLQKQKNISINKIGGFVLRAETAALAGIAAIRTALMF